MATSVIKSRNAQNLGTIAANNAPVVFGLGDVSSTYRGQLSIVCSGGAVTGPTWVLEASIDGGSTFFTITATTYTLTGLISGDTASLYAARYDVSGLAGALFKFGATAGTGWSATTVYALVG